MLRLSRVWIDQRVLVTALSAKRCSECGAELKLRIARCPLCGADSSVPRKSPSSPRDVDRYQADLRKLREQLRKLREDDAEAV